MSDVPLSCDSTEVLWLMDAWLGTGDAPLELGEIRDLMAQLHNRLLAAGL